ncbi:MAG: pyruvate kinase [Candidatus Omnitrophica bacterium]|nr:pyruvate kinase [Candidatus Omnitrophota bacterium]
MPKVKIIATLGPASGSQAMLRKMFEHGLDAVRLNFSHGNHTQHLQKIELVRNLNRKMRRAVKIMQDLEGYRIRVGKIKGEIKLKKRMLFYLSQEDGAAGEKEAFFDYRGSLADIAVKDLIYIDDGRIVLEVKSVESKRLKTKVVVGGSLKSQKGINIPGVRLDFSALTDKDIKDVQIAIDSKLDFVAQSFVRNAQDLKLLKQIVMPQHPRCKFFAKIENQEALKNLEEIIDEADGIIVARGDLGICVPIYKVPVIQKEIVRSCLKKKKPVVVATQMLESMTENAIPTRAEVSDVANAILDGATHLLLSGETAVGKYPDKVVDMMNKVIKNTEQYMK